MRLRIARPIRGLAVIGAISLAAGCLPSVTIRESQLKAGTAGIIGCPSSEIQVSGYPQTVRAGHGPIEWRAECRGKRYVCSGIGNNVNCAEERLPVASEPSAPTSPAAKP